MPLNDITPKWSYTHSQRDNGTDAGLTRLKNEVSVIQFYIDVALLNFTLSGVKYELIKNILNNLAQQLYFPFGVKSFNLLYIF